MTSDRIKEIQETTAYPDSTSVQQALLQVWNECEQERMYSEEDMISFVTFYYTHQGKATEYWGKDLFKVWFEQFKK